MFTRVGKRLALLNAAVVVGVIAATGVMILLLLQQALNGEEERTLRDRVRAARVVWTAQIEADKPIDPAVANPVAAAAQRSSVTPGENPLQTGDTFRFAFDRNGTLLIDERGLSLKSIPDMESVAVALRGRTDSRTVRVGTENVSIWTEPVIVDGDVIGAVQGARGQSEHESQRQLILLFTIIGVTLGTLVAVPAGLFLARRAMNPIEASFAQQRAFVSDASHELRTPLSVLRAQGEMVRRLAGADRPDIAEEADILVAEADEMNRLVADLLLLARIDEQPDVLSSSTLDLSEEVRAAASSLAATAEEAGLSFSVDADDPLTVRGDRVRLRQVVRILIDNATRYTPAGGEVEVTAEQRGGEARVVVRDTGIGIAAEDRAKVFDRFYRSDKARHNATGGVGLGLSIARAILRAHGGQIDVESTPGEGATFWFTLPLQRE